MGLVGMEGPGEGGGGLGSIRILFMLETIVLFLVKTDTTIS